MPQHLNYYIVFAILNYCFPMPQTKTSRTDLKRLAKRKPKSRKGENGSVLVIAGGKTYHGAAVFAGITASRLVDLVFFATAKENIAIIKKASPEFIAFGFNKINTVLPKADSVLIGPGLEKSKVMRNLICRLLKKNKSKKFKNDSESEKLF